MKRIFDKEVLEAMENYYQMLVWKYVKKEMDVPQIYNDILDLIEELKPHKKGEGK